MITPGADARGVFARRQRQSRAFNLRDKKRDRWILWSKKNLKVCHEMDINFDGKRDLSIRYYDDGITPRTVWWDLDYDGVWDHGPTAAAEGLSVTFDASGGPGIRFDAVSFGTAQTVPEPSSIVLTALALLGLAGHGRALMSCRKS